MTVSQFRLAFRIQRFEIVAGAILVVVVGITALIIRSRLGGVGAPVECLTPWIFDYVGYDAARCEPLRDAFLRIKWEEADRLLGIMHAVPPVAGLMLGVGLVGREIEGGTAPAVWALAGSRRSWLTGRLVPILVALFGILAFAAVTSEVLAQAAQPWLSGRPAFDGAGLRSVEAIPRGLACFGLALAVGAWSGRMLPTIVLSSLVALFLVPGGWLLFEAWFNANAHAVAVPPWFNGEYDGGRFRGSGGWPTAFGVVSADYPAWLATQVLAFGSVGLAFIASTYAIVERRRPF
jgi:hypothetical protein